MTDRPPIPEPIKRQVRQECGFGCILCGMPIFQYDHIIRYSEKPAHDTSNLALLCPNHHNEKTAGRLSRERIDEARRAPFNATRGTTTTYRLEPSRELETWIGSNNAYVAAVANDYPVLWINGRAFLTIHRDGDFFSFSASVTDEAGRIVLNIQRGELTVATDVWDYRYEGRTLSIRSGQGEIILEAEVADNTLRINRGVFVDQFAAGVFISSDGTVTFTMSGLHVGEICNSRFGVSNSIGIGVVRQSCFQGSFPDGGCYMRTWLPEFESQAEQLRQRMESGVPGDYPPGLATFRPYPRAAD